MSPKKKVIEIPATLNHENTSASKSLRVAAYCRVSTDSDEQENSCAIASRYHFVGIEGKPSFIR